MLESLDPPKQALLSARLQLVCALRTQPCLQQQGWRLAAQELKRPHAPARTSIYTSARWSESIRRRGGAARAITLVRTPYERLASTLPEQIAADHTGASPYRGFVSSLRVLARSVGYHPSDAFRGPLRGGAIRPEPSKRATLWPGGER